MESRRLANTRTKFSQVSSRVKFLEAYIHKDTSTSSLILYRLTNEQVGARIADLGLDYAMWRMIYSISTSPQQRNFCGGILKAETTSITSSFPHLFSTCSSNINSNVQQSDSKSPPVIEKPTCELSLIFTRNKWQIRPMGREMN